MSTIVKALFAKESGSALEPYEYELGDLGPHDVDIAVSHCGICHSDLSVLNNEWGVTPYPLVPGHEVSGIIAAKGEFVSHLEIGQRVGLGWYAKSCMTCDTCMGGDHNLCASAEATMLGRHGGFADRVRCDAAWATPIPDGVDPASAGPLFCGGITVFNPIVQMGVQPTHRVGVVGIGGLGHMALQFLNKWGCEVTAFTSSDAKAEEAKKLGAHRIVNSRSKSAIESEAGRYDMILSTVNVDLEWDAYINALGPRGKLHMVGVVANPVPAPVFPLIDKQRAISGSPLGSPATTRAMMEFVARHNIQPVTETFKMSRANDALEHLHEGKARYRIVLEQDLG